ncbi:hypothetical protein K1719_041518 [Acacia pycnantha]|nr:hypothetical protein K1719_041518 [Acacia pycnantha]
MSSQLLLLILLLCLSLHACTSRPLILLHKQTAKRFSYKDLDKVLVLEKFMAAAKPRPCTLKEKEVSDDETICESGCNASTLKEVKIGHYSNRHSGATSSFQTDSPSLLLRRHTRSMLGPEEHHVEETLNPSSGDTTLEDILEMDYAQPHRKPPIHNGKP